jgi:hypothetical protein
MPRFFVPGATASDEAERQFQRIRAHVVGQRGEPLDENERLFRLVHIGAVRRVYQVGEINSANGLIVAAIFELFGPLFCICSLRGDDVVVHEVTLETDDVVSTEAFDGDARTDPGIAGH